MQKKILGFILVIIVIGLIGAIALLSRGSQTPTSPENTTTLGSQAGASQMSDADFQAAQDAYTDKLSIIASELGYTLEVFEEKLDSQSLTEEELKKCEELGLAIAW